ncbi:2,3-dihydroxybenzoate-AMP ligase [Antarctobacter heliothermus]|uniref:3-methylmercaptopropionyl-CoA ligase n=1 Tax=Antarctobacter heliothermus TaxID=74033 RepID=A0A222E417_9RHOB|nr:AMP-binding protein [Antarctobacter heliothermus]ASP20933.1 2,3-dihydroxybenzoate-AMP ligase [Antarctobacter heliothermus]
MNISTWLARTAQQSPDCPALFLGCDPVASYGQFHFAAQCLAGALIARGIRPGDRVALFMKNVPDYLIAQYGAWYAGAAIVPINAKLHPREADFILTNSGASLVFATPDLAPDLAVVTATEVIETGSAGWQALLNAPASDAPVQRAPDDLAWLFYTSGTTGRPKGVIITHRMLVTMSLSYQCDCDLVRAEDAALYAAPLSHGAGIYNMMHVRAGARHVFPPSGGFDVKETLDLAVHFRGVHMFMAPTMVQRLTRHAKETDCPGTGLRTIVYAGGPMYNADIIEAVDHFGPIFVQIYGQGECPMGITALSRHDVTDRTYPRWRQRLGSVGRAQSAVEVRIADEDGKTVPTDAVGEILVRGDIVMAGYWKNPEASAKTLKDGWLWTGDMGAMDGDGYVTMKDRSKDLIISGGTNIYPREVEEALLEHPQVSEVAVVGRPHPEWGEEVVAFVVCDGSLDEAALDAHCLARIARFKRPKAYVMLPALPKNNYGKVLKTDLRASFGSAD